VDPATVRGGPTAAGYARDVDRVGATVPACVGAVEVKACARPSASCGVACTANDAGAHASMPAATTAQGPEQSGASATLDVSLAGGTRTERQRGNAREGYAARPAAQAQTAQGTSADDLRQTQDDETKPERGSRVFIGCLVEPGHDGSVRSRRSTAIARQIFCVTPAVRWEDTRGPVPPQGDRPTNMG
jgi:hypothetical protein